jgi:hypothetical protein
MLLHLIVKCGYDRIVNGEQIEGIVPTADIGPLGCVPIVPHQPASEILEWSVQVFQPVVAEVYPRREQGDHGNSDRLCAGRFQASVSNVSWHVALLSHIDAPRSQADLFEEACRATLKPDEATGLTL